MVRFIPKGETSLDAAEKASRGPTSTYAKKLGMVVEFIRTEARTLRCSIEDVPCPSPREWAALSSSGRRAVLPSEGQLRLYASPKMKQLISKMGSVTAAYFAVAKHTILNPPSGK